MKTQRVPPEECAAIKDALRQIYRGASNTTYELTLLRLTRLVTTWKCSVVSKPSGALMPLLFIKASRPGIPSPDFITERWMSHRMAKLHQPLPEYCRIEMYDPETKTLLCNWLSAAERPLMIIETQCYFNGPTLAEILRAHTQYDFLPEDRRIVISLKDMFRKIHGVKPRIFAEDGTETDLYLKGIKDIIRRMDYHAPTELDHPIISNAEMTELYGIARNLIRQWCHRTDRVGGLHGDPRTDNIIRDQVIQMFSKRTNGTTETEVEFAADTDKTPVFVPIDFSRLMWGLPGYDIGRFILDIVELSCESGNPYYNEFARQFMGFYAAATENGEIYEEALFGVFSMLLIKLDPSPGATPIQDPKVAKEFYRRCMGMLRAGKVSF